MLDPASSTAALAASGLYVYLALSLAALDAKQHQPQVLIEERPRAAAPAPAPAEEVLRFRGHLAFNQDALTSGPRERPDAPQDTIEGNEPIVTGWTEPRYVVGWRPVVQQHQCPDGSAVELVHHMGIKAVDTAVFERMQTLRKQGKNTDEMPRGPDGDDAPFRIVAQYDRGSLAYRLPPGYGIEVGPGGPMPQLMLSYHLLVPPCWDFDKQPEVTDTSGYDLIVTKTRPPHLATILSFTDEALRVEPKQGTVHFVTELDPAQTVSVGAHGQALSPWDQVPSPLELLAVHLHTHDMTQSKQFEVSGAQGLEHFLSPLEKFAKAKPTYDGNPWAPHGVWEGYGPTQSMKNLADLKAQGWPERIVLTRETKLGVHCNYDSDAFDKTLVDGLSWGEEMCLTFFVVGLPDTARADQERRPPTIMSLSDGHTEQGPLRTLQRAVTWLRQGFQRLI